MWDVSWWPLPRAGICSSPRAGRRWDRKCPLKRAPVTIQQGAQQLEEGEGALLLLVLTDIVLCSTSSSHPSPCHMKGVPALLWRGRRHFPNELHRSSHDKNQGRNASFTPPAERALSKKLGLPWFVTINTVVFRISVVCLLMCCCFGFFPGFLYSRSSKKDLLLTDLASALQLAGRMAHSAARVMPV